MIVTLLFVAAGVSGSAALALIAGVVIYGGSDAFARVLARRLGIPIVEAEECIALPDDTQEWDVEADFEEA